LLLFVIARQWLAKIVPFGHDDDTEDVALVAAGLMRKAERVPRFTLACAWS
jgi:hypothetical protein